MSGTWRCWRLFNDVSCVHFFCSLITGGATFWLGYSEQPCVPSSTHLGLLPISKQKEQIYIQDFPKFYPQLHFKYQIQPNETFIIWEVTMNIRSLLQDDSAWQVCLLQRGTWPIGRFHRPGHLFQLVPRRSSSVGCFDRGLDGDSFLRQCHHFPPQVESCII